MFLELAMTMPASTFMPASTSTPTCVPDQILQQPISAQILDRISQLKTNYPSLPTFYVQRADEDRFSYFRFEDVVHAPDGITKSDCFVAYLQFSLFKRCLEEDIAFDSEQDTIFHVLGDIGMQEIMQEIKHERAFRAILQNQINAGSVQVKFRVK